MIGSGASPLRPNIACSRSACSVLVGSPVDGPPRCTSTTSSGSSSATASPIVSLFSEMPGPGRGGDAQRAAERRAQRRADAGDLVLGLEGRDAERLVLAQLVQDVADAGVIGYEPRNTGSPLTCPAATIPYASAVLPVICR